MFAEIYVTSILKFFLIFKIPSKGNSKVVKIKHYMNEIPKDSNLSKSTLERLTEFYRTRIQNLRAKNKNNSHVQIKTRKTEVRKDTTVKNPERKKSS